MSVICFVSAVTFKFLLSNLEKTLVRFPLIRGWNGTLGVLRVTQGHGEKETVHQVRRQAT